MKLRNGKHVGLPTYSPPATAVAHVDALQPATNGAPLPWELEMACLDALAQDVPHDRQALRTLLQCRLLSRHHCDHIERTVDNLLGVPASARLREILLAPHRHAPCVALTKLLARTKYLDVAKVSSSRLESAAARHHFFAQTKQAVAESPRLHALDLSANALDDRQLAALELDQAQNLRVLNLANNQLHHNDGGATVRRLPLLRALSLDDNNIAGARGALGLQVFLGPALQALSLKVNPLKEEGLAALPYKLFANVTLLDLSFCHLARANLQQLQLAALPELRHLLLRGNFLTSDQVAALDFSCTPSLEILDLRHNWLDTLAPEAEALPDASRLAWLTKLPNLRALHLANNRLRDEHLIYVPWSKFTRLVLLNVSYNRLCLEDAGLRDALCAHPRSVVWLEKNVTRSQTVEVLRRTYAPRLKALTTSSYPLDYSLINPLNSAAGRNANYLLPAFAVHLPRADETAPLVTANRLA